MTISPERMASVARILRRRRMRGRSLFSPAEPCHKCGAECWSSDGQDSWFCFRCGNLGYMRDGGFAQQVDVLGKSG